jgi:hypothetical protein
VVVASLAAGCGAAQTPGLATATTMQKTVEALAANRAGTFDNLKIYALPDVAKDCSCSAIEASNTRYRITIQAPGGKLKILAVNGRNVVDDGELSTSTESLEDPALPASELAPIGLDDPLAIDAADPVLTDAERIRKHASASPTGQAPNQGPNPTASKRPSRPGSKVGRRMLLIARIYSGLQKATPEPAAKAGFNEAKKSLRAFIKANSPAQNKATGQIGV